MPAGLIDREDDRPMPETTAAHEQAATPEVAAPMNWPDYDTLARLLGESTCRMLGIYRIPDDLILSVVIPVYTEVHSLAEIVRQVRAVPISKQIILVDDCSKDGTTEMLRQWETTQPDLTIRFHEKNRGKGRAADRL